MSDRVKPHRRLVLTRAVLLAVVLLSACATRGQVEEIVAESNAALIGPYLDIPDPQEGQASDANWEQVLADIDRFIESHPGNASLVNHLRVRQAMLLTANGRRNLADQYWALVDRDALDSDRDRALADVGEHLSWWYQAAPTFDPVDSGEASAARNTLSTTIASTPEGSDIRIYLSTIRAQLEERMVRDDRLSPASTELPAALERYIRDIGADATWITGLDELTDADLATARQIKSFRYRIWLNELIGAYKETAEDLELPTPVRWRPTWVDGIG